MPAGQVSTDTGLQEVAPRLVPGAPLGAQPPPPPAPARAGEQNPRTEGGLRPPAMRGGAPRSPVGALAHVGEQPGHTSRLVWAGRASNVTGRGTGASSTSAHSRARPARGSRPTGPARTRAPCPTPLEAVPLEPWSAWDPVWAETAEGATSCPAAQPCRPVRRAGPRALVSDAGGGGPGRWSQGCAGCHSRPGPPPPPPPRPSPSWRSPFPCADTEPCPSPGSVLLQPPQGLPVGAGACPLHPRSHSGGPGRCPHGPGHCGPTATPCCL